MPSGLTDTIVNVPCLRRFSTPIEGIEMPERFTFPFYYDPHPLSRIAAAELQDYLKTQTDFVHNFGIDPSVKGHAIGKMFGVLVVETPEGALGYLAAFSGKLADSNDHKGFVPPIFDMLLDGDFFNEGMKIITPINEEIARLESSEDYLNKIESLKEYEVYVEDILKNEKAFLKQKKKARKQKRKDAESGSGEEQAALNKTLARESLTLTQDYKAIVKYWQISLFYRQLDVNLIKDKINSLKAKRKALSIDLQNQLFDKYNFLNQAGIAKNVRDIFANTVAKVPPSGAGECAAPKLFQYAFEHNLKLICMAEFWWGKPPKSDVRIHSHFYPSCRGKCEPILGHMLDGVDMDDNPMLINPAIGKIIEVVYEDEHMAIINKPADMLSVPGKTIKDSVASRMKQRYPNATGPLIVHRLDMSTSGILLIAKSKEIHKKLQSQFINRTIQKRYVALLDGRVEEQEGYVELPLRVDLDDRPRQLVCYEYGKPARTKWEVVGQEDNQTRVHLYPITGRTHQLRVHMAHTSGLGVSIVGDDLYGKKGNRLHLHAAWIKFVHPVTGKDMEITVDPAF